MFTLKKLVFKAGLCFNTLGWIMEYDSGTEVMINRDSWGGIHILLSEVKFLDLWKTN